MGAGGDIKVGGYKTVGCGRVSLPAGEFTERLNGTFSTGAGWPQVDETRW